MAKVILTTHQKGGVGKSTLTFNLAANLRDNAKVCIVDMDMQGSLFNIRETLIPLILGVCKVMKFIQMIKSSIQGKKSSHIPMKENNQEKENNKVKETINPPMDWDAISDKYLTQGLKRALETLKQREQEELKQQGK